MRPERRPIDEERTVGYVLPINPENTAHLIIFNTGLLVRIESSVATEDSLIFYGDRLAPDDESIPALSERPNTILRDLKRGVHFRVVRRSDSGDPADKENIGQDLTEAFTCAESLLTARKASQFKIDLAARGIADDFRKRLSQR